MGADKARSILCSYRHTPQITKLLGFHFLSETQEDAEKEAKLGDEVGFFTANTLYGFGLDRHSSD